MELDGLPELGRPDCVEADGARLHVERRTKGALRVVLVRHGRTEHGQNGIADKLFHKPVVAGDGLAQRREQRILEGTNVLGIKALGKRRETRKVGEQYRDLPAIRVPSWFVHCRPRTGYGAGDRSRRLSNDALGWRNTSRCSPRRTAAGAEGKVGLARGATGNTSHRLPASTAGAERVARRHLRTTPCTRHQLRPGSPILVRA